MKIGLEYLRLVSIRTWLPFRSFKLEDNSDQELRVQAVRSQITVTRTASGNEKLPRTSAVTLSFFITGISIACSNKNLHHVCPTPLLQFKFLQLYTAS